jgi:multisubunit Na+/H+ antiporter MnhB subunit
MLTPKRGTRQKSESKILGVIVAFGLAVPSVLLDFEASTSMKTHDLSFSSALWEFRALDVIGQGVVVLALALGVVMVLKERKKQARRKEH